MTTFKEFLEEEMKDPEFKRLYEKATAEERANLVALFEKLADDDGTPAAPPTLQEETSRK